jgi:hypothetical protein
MVEKSAVPKGRLKEDRKLAVNAVCSAVPSGLTFLGDRFPALKRRAILGRSLRDSNFPVPFPHFRPFKRYHAKSHNPEKRYFESTYFSIT